MAIQKKMAKLPSAGQPAASSPNDQEPLPLHKVLEDEYASLHGKLPPGYDADKTPESRLKAIRARIHALEGEDRRAALCISGGGIRSATFALGVLQGLARAGLLGKFHYLSTVSGGGYIGSWLSSWIHRAGINNVVPALAGATASATEPEPKQVRHLRSYSNYLSPKLGLFSADSWTLVAIYIRNLFLNWLVLIPFLAALLMLPRVYAAVLKHVTDAPQRDDILYLIVGLLLGVVGIAYIGWNRPAVRKDHQGWGQGAYLWGCLLPLTLSAILLTLYWAAYYTHHADPDDAAPLHYFIILGLAINVLGYLLWAFTRGYSSIKKVVGELVAAIVTGLTSGWLLWLAATAGFFFSENEDISRLTYACLAVPLTLGIFLLSAFLYNGLISFWTSDDDREWWSRSDGWLLLVIVGWTAFTLLVIFGPIWLRSLYVSGIGGASGLAALLLGKSGDTPANDKKKDPPKGLTALVKQYALLIAAPLFLIFILILLSAGTAFLLREILSSEILVNNGWLPPSAFTANSGANQLDYAAVVNESWARLVAIFAVLLFSISAGVAFVININRYSLHAMYRNRLIRAYLGASRPDDERKPNKFTGFDPNDNFPVWQMAATGNGRLFHVLNLTLNLVKGEELAWQERKAESFTVTPLHSGSCNPRLGYRASSEYGGLEKDPAQSGISLGTAMAISGAAASPNMGYHSSPVVGMLMALFNARLGWWLGNPGPAGRDTYTKEGPFWALKPLIAEAFGQTDDRSAYVYLSDGGHFENLGLYEMVLRRCRFIVVLDAGCDEKCSFEDLGNAMRKVRIDMGIPIEFNMPMNITARKADPPGEHYAALARIRYSCVDGPQAPDGTLVYIKPAFYGDEPRDVYNYAVAHEAFPHESTADQFFTESQFESYRMLGSHIMEAICGENYQAAGFDDFVEKLEAHLCPETDSEPPTPSSLQTLFGLIGRGMAEVEKISLPPKD